MTNQSAAKNSFSGILMLTLCSFIWGTAFIAQSVGGQYVEPLTFNWARSVLATVFLFGCCFITDKLKGRAFSIWGNDDPIYRDRLLKGGVVCGIALSIATYMQQLGIMYTTVGKSGFITALYIVLVQLLSFIFLRRSVSLLQGISVAIAAIGMYYICISEDFSINKGDLYTLVCAFCFAGQIICIENIIKNLDGVRLSFIQFATCTVFNGILMLVFESPSISALVQCGAAVAYAGVMSSGVAYTLQILGQKHVSSVLACMIMSLESAFALLSGWLLLGQAMSTREIFGCGLVFAAILLAQVPEDFFTKAK